MKILCERIIRWTVFSKSHHLCLQQNQLLRSLHAGQIGILMSDEL